jgi:hypothetical protein
MRVILGYLAVLVGLSLLHKAVVAVCPLITVFVLFWLISRFAH